MNAFVGDLARPLIQVRLLHITNVALILALGEGPVWQTGP